MMNVTIEVITTPINSNEFTEFDLKNLTRKIKKRTFPTEFTEIQKFPGIPNGISGSPESRELIPEWVFSVALLCTITQWR